MKNFRALIAAASLTAAMLPATAAAYTFDFSYDNPNGADVAGERGVEDGTVLDFDGVDIRFSAFGATQYDSNGQSTGRLPGYAYFDSESSGKPAGLGVCGSIDQNQQCVPSNDDNLTTDEFLVLQLYSDYSADASAAGQLNLSFDSIEFRDQQHNVITDTSKTFRWYNFDISQWVTSQMVDFSSGVAQATWYFSHTNQDYYIRSISASPVSASEPGSLAIVLLGTIGLVASRRRMRQHNA